MTKTEAPAKRTLTNRGIRTMLARRGIDHTLLTLTELDAGSVRVTGPDDQRKAATRALTLDYETAVPDMWLAPFSDYDILSRR